MEYKAPPTSLAYNCLQALISSDIYCFQPDDWCKTIQNSATYNNSSEQSWGLYPAAHCAMLIGWSFLE